MCFQCIIETLNDIGKHDSMEAMSIIFGGEFDVLGVYTSIFHYLIYLLVFHVSSIYVSQFYSVFKTPIR